MEILRLLALSDSPETRTFLTSPARIEVREVEYLLCRTGPLPAGPESTKVEQECSKSLIPKYFTCKSLFLKDLETSGL